MERQWPTLAQVVEAEKERREVLVKNGFSMPAEVEQRYLAGELAASLVFALHHVDLPEDDPGLARARRALKAAGWD